jgi:large subunit ribosomal protein L4
MCYSSDGEPLEEREISLPVFDGDRGRVVLRDVVLAYQNNCRQGDAHTKTRDEVAGTGKKPYRQKGTGNARRGERRSPICTGGGVTFGPRKRDYTVKINKKARRIALARVLFDRLQGGDIFIFEDFPASSKPSTKEFFNFLRKIPGGDSGSVLLLDASFNENVILSFRNLPNVAAVDARALNAWHALNCNKIFMTLRAAEALTARISAKS